MTSDDGLLLEIARRLADGEWVDLSAEKEALDPEIARGLEMLRKVLGIGGKSTPDRHDSAAALDSPPRLVEESRGGAHDPSAEPPPRQGSRTRGGNA